MSNSTFANASIPHDEPKEIRPGVMHKEDDAPGNQKWYALPPEAPERTSKGDLGFAGLKPSKPSFESSGEPFANLRKR
jgi:hypothetical protein